MIDAVNNNTLMFSIIENLSEYDDAIGSRQNI